MMGGVSPETCGASYKYEIKFGYTVASCWIFFVNYTMMHGSTNIKNDVPKTDHPKNLKTLHVRYFVCWNPPLDRMLSQLDPLHKLTSLFFYIPCTLNIIFLSTPSYYEWCLFALSEILYPVPFFFIKSVEAFEKSVVDTVIVSSNFLLLFQSSSTQAWALHELFSLLFPKVKLTFYGPPKYLILDTKVYFILANSNVYTVAEFCNGVSGSRYTDRWIFTGNENNRR
jgi:hypothetical protein